MGRAAALPAPDGSITQDLTIGSDSIGSQYYFDGDLDDLRIYDRALSDGEIAELALTPTVPGMPGLWSLVATALFLATGS